MDFSALFANAFRAAVGPEAAVYALAAIGLNVHFGYTGLLNFGQVGFMLVGAYGIAVTVATFGGPLWLGVLVGIVLAVLLALLLGIPTLRLRADYLAIVTIAAAEILRFVFRSSPARPVTGGVFGLQQFAGQFYALNPLPVRSYGIGPVMFSHRRFWVVLVGWALVALCALIVWALMRSPWGRVLKSIREDEDAARSLGKNVFSYKMQSLVIGGVMGGIAGMVFALNQQAVNPDTYLPIITFYAYTILILGGPARVIGPIVGSILFWFLLAATDAFLRQGSAAGFIPLGTGGIGAVRFTLVGLGLMLLMAFRPQGIFGDKREMQLDV
jgi:neutral amino acid transport system permease protein